MKLKSVTVKNYKAIKTATVELKHITVLVGENSSGKTSFLQAMHWAFRCVSTESVKNNQSYSAHASDLDYSPTLDATSVGHNSHLSESRNNSGPARVDVEVTYLEGDNQSSQVHEIPKSFAIPIQKGRNNTVQVNLQKDNKLDDSVYNLLKDKKRPFSSYIPGLAGIPFFEEKKSTQPVMKIAAGGDANLVLRNILLQIKERDKDGLEQLERHVSEVLGATKFKIDFSEDDSSDIKVYINTEYMDENYWAPLELAGTGALQVVQIFSYLVLYRSKVLLIDEPDAHLHPDRQSKLITALEKAAIEMDVQIIMTTHNPHLVRGAPDSVSFAWFADGTATLDQESIRKKMGWGLLDKTILIVSEDANTSILEGILRQWPDLHRRIAIWPTFGVENLPSSEGADELKKLTGVDHVIVHRDSDFMIDFELNKLRKEFAKANVKLWLTKPSDIEGYFCHPDHLAAVLACDKDTAIKLLGDAKVKVPDADETLRKKRSQINKKDSFYAGGAGTPTLDDVKKELDEVHPCGWYKGKTLLGKVNELIQESEEFKKVEVKAVVPAVTLANDLKSILDKCQ